MKKALIREIFCDKWPMIRVLRVLFLPLTLELFADGSFPLFLVNMITSHAPLQLVLMHGHFTRVQKIILNFSWLIPNHDIFFLPLKFNTRKFPNKNYNNYGIHNTNTCTCIQAHVHSNCTFYTCTCISILVYYNVLCCSHVSTSCTCTLYSYSCVA